MKVLYHCNSFIGRVGKTSILLRHFNNKFSDTEKSTTNPSFFTKKIQHNGQNYVINFWDTAGQEQFDALNTIYYQGAVGALVLYDVNSPETFNKVKNWVNELKMIIGNDTKFVVAGNKFDLVKSREELNKNQKNVDDYIKQENVRHFFTSAKSGENVAETFDCLIHLVLENLKPEQRKGGKGKLVIAADKKGTVEKKKGCC